MTSQRIFKYSGMILQTGCGSERSVTIPTRVFFLKVLWVSLSIRGSAQEICDLWCTLRNRLETQLRRQKWCQLARECLAMGQDELPINLDGLDVTWICRFGHIFSYIFPWVHPADVYPLVTVFNIAVEHQHFQ